MTAPPPLVLLTDFGTVDAYVGVMKGVIAGIAPGLPVIDLCHAVPPQDVARGADLLAESWRWFPAGTVFVGVVDPGVGTDRRALLARIDGRLFVGPDNGLCSRVTDAPFEARALPDAWGLPARSATFHGRDLFAPAAARLASGQVAFDDAPPLHAPVRLPRPAPGAVRAFDHFGNALTDLPERADGALIWNGRHVPVVRTYGDAPPGALVALTGSAGLLELAVVGGSARASHGVALGDAVAWTP